MSQTLDQKRRELIERVSELPEKTQNAILWLISNYDLAMQICKAQKLTEQERCQVEEIAKRKDDPLLLLLSIMERTVNKD